MAPQGPHPKRRQLDEVHQTITGYRNSTKVTLRRCSKKAKILSRAQVDGVKVHVEHLGRVQCDLALKCQIEGG